MNCVRERWSDALIKRREYLDEQIQKISNKQGLQLEVSFITTSCPIPQKGHLICNPNLSPVEKSEDDIEREARLVEQWVGLTEERNAVFVPAPGSGIPGAPANWYVQKSHWSCQLFVHNLCMLQGTNLSMFWSFLCSPVIQI